MFDFERVCKECFWDSFMTEEMFFIILNSDNMQEKQYLFEKILLNSTKMLQDLKIFDNKELQELIEKVKIPNFNDAYVNRRKNLGEVYFLGRELEIDELKWVA